MDKKTLLGVGLLAGFLLLWQSLIVPSLPDDWMYDKNAVPLNAVSSEPQSTSTPSTPAQLSSSTVDQAAASLEGALQAGTETVAQAVEKEVKNIPEQRFTIETDTLIAVFSSKGGALVELHLKAFHPHVDQDAPLTLIDQASLMPGSLQDDFIGQLSETDTHQTLVLWNATTKMTYRFQKEGYFFDLQVQNLKSEGLTLHLAQMEADPSHQAGMSRGNEGAIVNLAQRDYGDNSTAHLPKEIYDNGGMQHASPSGDLRWAGFRNAYFGLFLQPTQDNTRSHTLSVLPKSETNSAITMAINDGQEANYKVYAGPLDKKGLYQLDSEFYGPLFNYTGINVIIHFLLWLLNFYNAFPGLNMGVAILMLTLTVRGAMFPLNLKAQSSMFMMSKVGPKVKALQEKYKNDRQQLGVEQMKLFKEEGINPMAGCLPMLIQMPVMISLFSTVGEGFALRHAPFISWIQDLSSPDALFLMPFDIPFLGNGDGTMNFNLLVILYIITMLIQQSMMPKSTDPQQQQTQKMMKFMMVGFAVILYNYSSGLMLYFVGSNCLGMAESWYIRNRILPAMEKKRQAKA